MRAEDMGYLCGVYYTLAHWQHAGLIAGYLKMWKTWVTACMLWRGSLNMDAAQFVLGAQQGACDTMLKILGGHHVV
jgi:hypothetical protein